MTLINKILSYENLKIKIFLTFSFLVVWASVGSSYHDLIIFYSNEPITIVKIIKFFRVVLIVLIFPFLSFLLIKTLAKSNKLQLKEDFLIYCIFIYFLLQIPGLFYTSNSIENLIYVISAINFLIIIKLFMETLKYNEVLILIYTVFIILFSVLAYSFLTDLLGFFTEVSYEKKFYGSLTTILGDNNIRSSGISRISLVLLVIYVTILKKNITKRILKELPIFIFSTIIFLYESRAVVLLLILFVVIKLFFKFFEKKFFNKFIKYFICFIMLPLLISLQINSVHSSYEEQIAIAKNKENLILLNKKRLMTKVNNYSLLYYPFYSKYTALDDFSYTNLIFTDADADYKDMSNADYEFTKSYSYYTNSVDYDLAKPELLVKEKTKFCKVIKCVDDTNRLINKEKLFTTSGRLNDWKEILHRFHNRDLIFGYGSQGDRYLINQTASNGIMYAFSSSGFVGMSFFIFFSFIISLKIIKFFFLKKINDPINQFSVFILIIFLVRSLIESSYAVFGIDFMLFNISFFLLNKYNSTRM